jgi:hypothetical protein
MLVGGHTVELELFHLLRARKSALSLLAFVGAASYAGTSLVLVLLQRAQAQEELNYTGRAEGKS